MDLLPNARTLPVVQAPPTVMPEPQPSSFGNISNAMPLRRTNRMPARQRRSGKPGRPPLGLEGSGRAAAVPRYTT
jgi:hypothetical protein